MKMISKFKKGKAFREMLKDAMKELVRSLKVRIVTELTKAPNFAQQ